MKKMTCSAMGGCCEADITGATAEEMSDNGRKHVHEAADNGDAGHKELVEKMSKISPEDLAKWNEEHKARFATAPDA